MRVEQLEYLTAVTRHSSLRRASEQLHLSQPALSESLSKLEKELGVPLLDRHRSGARISWQGRELLPHMTAVLDAVDRLLAAADEQRSSSRLVRLGTVGTATATVLIPALRAVQKAHPGTAIEVRDLTRDEIGQGLADGAIDLGLVNALDSDETPPGLRATTLLHGRPVALLPGGHRLGEQAAVSVEDLRAEPFVFLRSGHLMHRVAHRMFGDRPPRSTRAADGIELAKVMVAEGLGITLLPDFSIAGDPFERSGLISHRPVEDAEVRVRLVLLESPAAYASEPSRALATALRDHAARSGS